MKRRTFTGAALMAAAGAFWAAPVRGAQGAAAPDIFTVLKTRRSVRAYTDEPVSQADIDTMLRCAMLAPSAANEQAWEFIVITDKAVLAKASEIGPYASMAKRAPLAILLCLNKKKEKVAGMGVIDMGTCAENLMLAAKGLGLGSVFTGIYPLKDRMAAYEKLFALPDYIVPIGMIVIGHPEIKGDREVDRFNQEAVHYNKW